MGRFSILEPGGEKKKKSLDATSPAKAKIQTPHRDLEEEDHDFYYYCEHGDSYFYTGNYKKALTHYSRAMQQEGAKPYPWCMQVFCLLEMGQVRDADLWANRAQAMFPENSTVISVMAVSYAYRGAVQRALATSDFALGKGGEPFAWIARGVALLESDNKNAQACFDKIFELPESRNDWKMIAMTAFFLLRYKKYSQAIVPLKKAIAFKENNFFFWYLLGKCYYKLGFSEEAKNALNQALEYNPNCKEAEQLLRNYQSPIKYLLMSLRKFLPFKK